MIDAVLTTLKLALDPIDRLSSLYRAHHRSKRDELCHALYRLFISVDEIILTSEGLLSAIQVAPNEKSWKRITAANERIAKCIARTWEPLQSLVKFMRIADPDIAEYIESGLGPKFMMVFTIASISKLVFDANAGKKTLQILAKLDATKVNSNPHDYWNINKARVNRLVKAGAVEVLTYNLRDPDDMRLLIQRGRLNVAALENLRDRLRKFMVQNFNKEDFFFHDIHA